MLYNIANLINKKFMKKISLFVIVIILIFNFTTSAHAQSGFFTTGGGVDQNRGFTISTNGATNITSGSVLLNGLLNGNNLYNNSTVNTWFEYGTTMNLGYATQRNVASYNYGSFSSTVGGLTENTVYYFRAAAQNNQGTIYGGTYAFRTNASDLVIASNDLSDKTSVSPALIVSTTEKVAPQKTTTSVKKESVEKTTTNNDNKMITFLPMTILGWLALIILILLLIITIKHFINLMAGKKENEKKSSHH